MCFQTNFNYQKYGQKYRSKSGKKSKKRENEENPNFGKNREKIVFVNFFKIFLKKPIEIHILAKFCNDILIICHFTVF